MDFKQYFPIFKTQPDLVYLDSAATALKPQSVLNAMNQYYAGYSANVGRGVYKNAVRSTEAYELARKKVAEFLSTSNEQVIFTSGTTDSINKAANMLKGWGKNKKIVVSDREHHSNFVPWQQLAKQQDSEFVVWDMNSDIDWKNVGILAITHVSNVTGEVVSIQNMVASIKHINPEIIVVADGAQAVAHMKVLVEDMGVDMYAFSGHKLYGPTGIGVLWVDKKLLSELEPVVFGGGMISSVDSTSSSWAVGVARYEAGTPPIAEAIGLGEAIEYVKKYVLVSETIETERKLLERLKTGLVELGCKVIEGKNSMSVVSFTVDGVHPHDVAEVLAEDNVCVRAGHHCAQPLHTKLGISESVRISLGIYNEEDDVRKLLAGIQKVTDIFKLHG